MSTKQTTTLALVFIAAFDATAQTAPSAAGSNDGHFFPIMWFSVVLFILAVYLYRFLRVQKLKRQNYDWYVAQNPKLVSGGRVRCLKCDSSNIGTERLMNRTFLRVHVCRQCGTALYYSKES